MTSMMSSNLLSIINSNCKQGAQNSRNNHLPAFVQIVISVDGNNQPHIRQYNAFSMTSYLTYDKSTSALDDFNTT